MDVSFEDWTVNEKNTLLKRTLKEYRHELGVAEMMTYDRVSKPEDTNAHYLDYLRAVIHDLTKPSRLVVRPPIIIEDLSAEEDEGEEGEEREEATIRGVPADQYDEAVREYAADMGAAFPRIGKTRSR